MEDTQQKGTLLITIHFFQGTEVIASVIQREKNIFESESQQGH